MIRNIFIFLGTFAAGALIALAIRTARFNPHESTAVAASPAQTPAPAAQTATPAPANAKPVNTVCAICGMDVDPKLPTAQYQGKTIGFGCKMCPPKFKAEPDRWGPLYLRNEVAKN